MAGSNTLWFGERVLGEVRNHIKRGMLKAGVFLTTKVKKNISKGPGPQTKGVKGTAREIMKIHRKGSPRGPRSRIHSKPGEYPFKQSDTLRSNVSFEVDNSRLLAPKLYIGVMEGVEYAAKLEFYPPLKGGRPFLRRTIAENSEQIYNLMVRG